MGREPGLSSWRCRIFLRASGRAGEVHLSWSRLAWLRAAQPLGASVPQERFVCQGAGLQPVGTGRGREASLWKEHICPTPPSPHRALSQLPHRSPCRPPRIQNKTKPQILPFLFLPQGINSLSVSTACPRLPPPLLPPAAWESAGQGRALGSP